MLGLRAGLTVDDDDDDGEDSGMMRMIKLVGVISGLVFQAWTVKATFSYSQLPTHSEWEI